VVFTTAYNVSRSIFVNKNGTQFLISSFNSSIYLGLKRFVQGVIEDETFSTSNFGNFISSLIELSTTKAIAFYAFIVGTILLFFSTKMKPESSCAALREENVIEHQREILQKGNILGRFLP